MMHGRLTDKDLGGAWEVLALIETSARIFLDLSKGSRERARQTIKYQATFRVTEETNIKVRMPR